MLVLGVAAQIVVTAAAPDTVTVNAPFTVTVSVSSPAAERPDLVPPRVAPFVVRDVRRRVKIDSTSGWVTWRNSEWRYTLTAARTGTYTLPAFEARAGRHLGRSLPLRITVAHDRPQGVAPAIVTRAALDTSKGVGFHAIVTPDTVYVGQQATYQVGVFLDDVTRLRLRRNPEFVPPEMRAVLAYDLPPMPGGPIVRRFGGRRWDVHVFERALFPLSAGRYEIPSARLVYSLPLSSSFFSREEQHTARAERRVLVVRDAPEAGRPADWSGATGALAVAVRLDSGAARVGDPLLMTVRVSGRGNVKLLPRPDVAIPWATVVAADERVRVDSVPSVVQGTKEFDFLVTPRETGTQLLPPVRYPVFNPYTERYEILATAPESLLVAPGSLAAAELAPDQPLPLALRPTLRAAVAPPPYAHSWFWLVGLLAPLPAAAAAVARRPRRTHIVTPASRLRALARSRTASPAHVVRQAFTRALTARLALSPAALTERYALAHAMRRAGVTIETADAAAAFLASLSSAAWARGDAPLPQAAQRAWTLYAAVDAEARPDPRVPLRRTGEHVAIGICLAVALAAAPLVAEETGSAGLFARATTLYAERRFAESARLFARVAERAPRAADAWANFGTSSWEAGDTTAAVVGWERGLRLEPLAFDLRERLAMVPAPRAPMEAWVPPVPPGEAGLAALAAWVLACGAALVMVRRGSHGARAAAIGFATTAGIVAVVTGLAHEASSARRLVVLDRTALRTAPALGGEPVPGEVAPGSVARLTRRQGVWAHVALGDGRDGWLPMDHARPLVRR